MKKKDTKIELSEKELTLQEWLDALKVPTPHRNKKKYYRKKKHKGREDC